MPTVVSAPGNLFGSEEHVTVYTKNALLVAPGVRTRFKIEENDKPEIYVFSKDLKMKASVPVSEKLDLDGVNKKLIPTFKLVEKVAQDLKLELRPMRIKIDSEIPVGSGLSSSTALLVAGYFAVANFLGANPWKMDSEKVYKNMLPIQEYIHGKASGMEIFSSRFGGFGLINNKELVKHFRIPKSKRPVCIIGDTQISRNTKDVVSMVAKWKKENPEEAEKIFSRIHQITVEMDKAIDKFDWVKVGKLMNENHQLLRKMGPVDGDRIGVSHKVLDQMVDAAVKAGAYGAKMSGAGWGGNMFAICSEETKDAVLKAISRFGRAYVTELGTEGVRLES
jgi:mevalonate kinase